VTGQGGKRRALGQPWKGKYEVHVYVFPCDGYRNLGIPFISVATRHLERIVTVRHVLERERGAHLGKVSCSFER
jgi:hypothetical protein